MAYPFSITIEPLRSTHNRLTTAVRLILAIPCRVEAYMLLVVDEYPPFSLT